MYVAACSVDFYFYLKDKDEDIVFRENPFDKCVESLPKLGLSLPQETILHMRPVT